MTGPLWLRDTQEWDGCVMVGVATAMEEGEQSRIITWVGCGEWVRR